MKAYAVTDTKWPAMVLAVAAVTPGQARSTVLRLKRLAGYACKFTELRARRAPEYDDWADQREVLGWDDPVEGERYGCYSLEGGLEHYGQ